MPDALGVVRELWPREIEWHWWGLVDSGELVLRGIRRGREAQRTVDWRALSTGRYGMSPLLDAAKEIWEELVPLAMPLLWEGDNA